MEGYWTEGTRPTPDLKADLKKIRDQIMKDTGGLVVGVSTSPIIIPVSMDQYRWALENGYVTEDGSFTDKFGREVREADEDEDRRAIANEVGSGI